MEGIVNVALNYFDNLFKASSYDQMEKCLNVVSSKVTLDMQQILSSEFSTNEIKAVLFKMGTIKAPGPYSMNAFFYQKFWHAVGDFVVATALDFLNSSNMASDINHINIVLILKVKNPEKMSDFKPINLCNFIYKIIPKYWQTYSNRSIFISSLPLKVLLS